MTDKKLTKSEDEVEGAEGGYDYSHVKSELSPFDSASQIGSHASSTSSARAKAAAKKAGLLAKMDYFRRQQDLDLKRFELSQKSRQLDLEAEITAAAVEEEVLSKFEAGNQDAAASTLLHRVNPVSDLQSTLPYGEDVTANQVYSNKESNPGQHAESLPSHLPYTHLSSKLNPTVQEWRGPSSTNYDPNLLMQRQMIDVMSLPKSTLMKFNGDPMDYWVFINAFDSSVGRSTVDDAVKLNRLFEYCTGKAAKAIKPCSMMNPYEGYSKARKLLFERFGNKFTISEAWIRKVTEGPPIKAYKGEALQDLSDDLLACVEALEAMKMVEEIDTRVRMLKILDRLPAYLQARWRKEAVATLNRLGSYPNIRKLAEFVDRTSKEMNDPIFGCHDRNDITPKRKASSYNIQAVESKQDMPAGASNQSTSNYVYRCYMCKDNHRLSCCAKFLKLSCDKRLDLVKENRLCFNCLQGRNHTARWCRKPSDCNMQGCNLKHSRLIHEALQANFVKRFNDERKGADNQASQVVCATAEATSYACRTADEEPHRIALPIVSVRVRAPGQEHFIHTQALLDPGSNKSFCSADLVQQLGIKCCETSLTMKTLAAEEKLNAMEIALEVMSAGPSSRKKKHELITLPKVYGIKEFPPLISCVPVSSDMSNWNHLQGIKFDPPGQSRVNILIGQDVPHALMPLEVRRGERGQPYAIRTALGWTINGPLEKSDVTTGDATCHFVHANQLQQGSLEAQVENFWKVDTEYSLADGRKRMSVEDKSVIDVWNRSMQRDEEHYVLDIPFKHNPPELPNNRILAERRLQHLGRRLQKDPNLYDNYKAGINDLIEKGYAEIVPESGGRQGLTWYLPHHCVTNPNKPGKFRIVFDCAAEYDGTSLNKQVLQGPDLTSSLLGVLLRFREQSVAVMGDIEAMFHQVKVSPHHRDVLRFLWWQDGDLSHEPLVYRMTVHLFGGVWSPSCASFALQKIAKDHPTDFDTETTTTVLENFYADDCLRSMDTEEKACRLVKQLCELLALGGFRLTKWVSNSRLVLQSIPSSERAKQVNIDFQQSTLPQERALGVQWDTETDQLGIKIKLKDGKLTRRGLLSIMSSVYDPMGLVCPFILVAKIIFQSECRTHKGWDDELEPTNKLKWQRWLKELPLLELFKLNRCLITNTLPNDVKITLHTFCDASQEAYGCVSYLRLENPDRSTHCSFLLAKSKLAPMKQLTVPRLELSAAVLGVKLDTTLRREMRLNISGTFFWTDSTIVLQYIKNNTKRFHTFVANRIAIIHDASTPDQWKFVDGESNPADDATRGLDAARMVSSDRWKQGPEFLWKDENCWPVIPDGIPDMLKCNAEVKQDIQTCAAITEDAVATEQPFDKILSKYSSWYRLKKAVAWLARFKTWLQSKDRQSCKSNYLQVSELQSAEKDIIFYLQCSHFGREMQALEIKSGRISRNSSIYGLEPHKGEDGLLRVGGRLQAAPIAEQSQHPAILPRDHHVTELIVRDVHESGCRHSGREYVLSLLRKRYWVPRSRPLINRVLRNCVVCKRLKAKPGVQRMANLPNDRVTPDKPPFTYVGIDCFGPFFVKRGRGREKRYGCIFTCLTTRAVHIEKLNTMDADSFLNALVRFMSRRGIPEKIRSDNGTNFVGGDKELRNSIKEINENHKLKNIFLHQEIEWEFNPPAASHMGGVWERQIRTVRKVLNSILREQVLDDERLDTIFCEVESIVNGRPLTPVSDDPSDMESLTPNHLLLLRAGPVAPPGKFDKADVYGRRWRHVQFLADLFWKRWLHEYLPTLILRQKWIEPQRNLEEGDMVIMKDENTPRKCWPLGRVVKVFPGKDGFVRSAEVKTCWGSFTRPINKLCFIESI